MLVLAKALPGGYGSLALERIQEKFAAVVTGDTLPSVGEQNENPDQSRSALLGLLL